MDLFGAKRRAEARARIEISQKIMARVMTLEAFAISLAVGMPEDRRNHLLEAMRAIVVSLGEVSHPKFAVPDGEEQAFRNELSRVMQTFVEVVNAKSEPK